MINGASECAIVRMCECKNERMCECASEWLREIRRRGNEGEGVRELKYDRAIN